MLRTRTNYGGWESVHQRTKKAQYDDPDRWRSRDWDDHPNDPGWENGTYSSCHPELRQKAEAGDVVFDTVYTERPTEAKPIVRSAFVVEDASANELSFSAFAFLDGSPDEGVRGEITRGHKPLDASEVEGYLQQIDARDAYTVYEASQKPESVPQEVWDEMLSRAGRDSDGSCGSCGSSDGC